MPADTLVIVPAAGTGTRFGGELPKQFQSLAGKPILQHVIERFVLNERVIRVIVPVSELLLEVIKQSGSDRVRFVAGGATRQESVRRALAAAEGEYELIAVHDAVRPFFGNEMFDLVLDAARESGAALPVVPITDTIHGVVGDSIRATLDRTALVAAQTPQCFRAEILREVMQRAGEAGDDTTDEAGLAAKYGFTVTAVPGDPINFKITRPHDMMIADALMKEWANASV